MIHTNCSNPTHKRGSKTGQNSLNPLRKTDRNLTETDRNSYKSLILNTLIKIRQRASFFTDRNLTETRRNLANSLIYIQSALTETRRNSQKSQNRPPAVSIGLYTKPFRGFYKPTLNRQIAVRRR